MIGIWACKCFSFLQERLSLDGLVDLCGLHVNSLSREILLSACSSQVICVENDSNTKHGLPDVISSSWQSRSPPCPHVRSS